MIHIALGLGNCGSYESSYQLRLRQLQSGHRVSISYMVLDLGGQNWWGETAVEQRYPVDPRDLTVEGSFPQLSNLLPMPVVPPARASQTKEI